MSVTGTGIHASSGAAALAVKGAIHAAIGAALDAADEHEVSLAYGYLWPAQWDDQVAVTAVRIVPQEGTTGPRQRRHMTVQQDVNITAFRVTADEQETHARAFGLLALVDQGVRADATLAGTALWCVLGEVQSDGATLEEDAGAGRVTEIAATFEARVVVSS